MAAVRHSSDMLRLYSFLLTFLVIPLVSAQDQLPHGVLPWNKISVNAEPWVLVESPLRDFDDKKHALNFDVLNYHVPSHSVTWEIREDILFLTDIQGNVAGKPFDPRTAFGSELPVRAEWYSGRLTLLNKQIEPSYSSTLEHKFVPSQVYLVNRGHVVYKRNLKRLAFGLRSDNVGFSLKRKDDHFIAVPRFNSSDENRIGYGIDSDRVVGGDIVHGLVDPNGISLEFSTETEELANAALSGARGTHLMVIISSPEKPSRIRAVKVERK
jgi:hypothetical protein